MSTQGKHSFLHTKLLPSISISIYLRVAGESDAESLLSSQLTGREFGGSMTQDLPSINSSLSLSGSQRPTSLLKSNESLASVTSGSKPPSERSNISLTPPAGRRSQASHLYTKKKLLLGLLIVVLIALSWVGSTQAAKSSFNRKNFQSPFFVTWFGTGWMIVVFPLSCVLYFLLNTDKWNWNGVKELWR